MHSSSNDWLKDRFVSGDCSDGDVVWVRNQTKEGGGKSVANRTHENLTFSLFKFFTKLTIQNAFAINCAITLGVLKALQT